MRSGKRVGPRRGVIPTMAMVAGAAARGARWLSRSGLGKRVASAAAGYAAGHVAKRVKTKETDNGAGASAQYVKNKFKLGYKRSKNSLFSKLIRRNMRCDVLRFGATERFTNNRGAYQLALTPAGGGLYDQLPIALLELTSKVNYSDTSYNPLVNIKPFWEPRIERATGLITWTNQVSRFSDGSSTSDYYGRISSNKAGAASNGILEWTNAKFLFRCPRTRPGWIKISLVQFLDEDLMPLFPARNTDIKNKHHGFWQARAKALLYNPIAHEAHSASRPGNSQGMKVVKTWVRRFSPDTSDNLATYNGEQIRMDIFIRHNRFVNSSSSNNGAHTNMSYLDDDAYVTENTTEDPGQVESYYYNTAANPKARVFFLIEGTNFDASSDISVGANGDPIHITYDMEVRNKWVYQDSSHQ